MYCPKCGSNVGVFDFCPHCGANVRELLENLEPKENIDEPAAEKTEERASHETESYTASVTVKDDLETEQDISIEEKPADTDDEVEETDETDGLFADYFEPYLESGDSLANYKKRLKIRKIILAVLLPVIIAVSVMLVYNHLKYSVYKVPPLNKTNEYLLEEGSVPEHTIPTKVKTPERPNIKRLLSNVDYEKKHNSWSEKETAYKYYYEICLKDKKTSYGFAEYDINGNLDSIAEYEPCIFDSEVDSYIETYNSTFNEGNISLPYVPKYRKTKFVQYYKNNTKIGGQEKDMITDIWYDISHKPYYELCYYADDHKNYTEIRYDKNGRITYINFYGKENVSSLWEELDYPTVVVVFDDEKVVELWCFDLNNQYVESYYPK